MAGYRKPFEHRQGQGAPTGRPSHEKPRKYLFELMKKHHGLLIDTARDCLLALKNPLMFEVFLDSVNRKHLRVLMDKVRVEHIDGRAETGGKCIAKYIENGGDNAWEIINRRGGIEIGEFLRMAVHHNQEIGSVEAGKFVGKGNIEKIEGFLKGFGGGPSGMFICVAGGENMAGFLDEVGVEKAVGYARKEKIGGAREIRNNFAKAVERAKALKVG